mmetsp:Transcript_12918/g.36220  ORF Transcript_12918/g.36220 Transcript_12918/m.36220 type:complete len:437 (-) Transcript_12918:313-1623(-)
MTMTMTMTMTMVRGPRGGIGGPPRPCELSRPLGLGPTRRSPREAVTVAPRAVATDLSLGPDGATLPVDQKAFMELVTAPSVAEAPAVFGKWGIVRIPSLLSPGEVDTLLREAREHGIRRTAFAQDSPSDRYTLWIAGDGMSDEQLATTKTIKERVPFIERAIFHGDESSWRPVCDGFGYPNLMLAEVVTAAPGGAPQGWHFDGEGITAQISLVPIGAMNGPTEIQPRPTPRAYMQWMKHLSNQPPGESQDEMAEVLSELTTEIKMMYDRLTMAHEFAWNTLRPILGNNVGVAKNIIEAGLTPPVVHMVADPGVLTLYDASMIHRGGQNRGTEERPILAVHINKENKHQRKQTRLREQSEGLGQVMSKAGVTKQQAAAAASKAAIPEFSFGKPSAAGAPNIAKVVPKKSKAKKAKFKGSVKSGAKKAGAKKKGGFGG